MRLYAVYNGWQGNGPTHVLVIAGDQAEAIRLASESVRAEADEVTYHHEKHPTEARLIRVGRPRYPESYYDPAKLTAEVLCEDTTRPWASPPRD